MATTATATYCPNCDAILGNGHCGNCGFNIGDPLTRAINNPFIPGRTYGRYAGELVAPTAKPPVVQVPTLPTPTPTPTPTLAATPNPTATAKPEPEPKPITKTVQ